MEIIYYKINAFSLEVGNIIRKIDKNAKCGDCIFWRSSQCPEKSRDIDFSAFFYSPTQLALCGGRYFELRQKEEIEIDKIVNEIVGKDVFLELLKTLSHTVKRDHYAKQFDIC